MRIWQGSGELAQNFQGGVVTVGKFDGLHLGHQKLLEAVRRGPKPWIVLTFDPLPVQVLFPPRGYRRLMPKDDLKRELPRLGIDLLGILPFDQSMAAMSAGEFAEEYLWRPFQPKQLVVGYDFAFGKNREGGAAWLQTWCAGRGIGLSVAAPLELDGRPVSSGRVRELVHQGDVTGAARLLGRPFYLSGEVVRGAGRGRGIGVPTLNQNVENETLPALGVYASRTLWRGRKYPSVTNVGRVPTFTDEKQIAVETHVIGAHIDAYGDRVEVELVARLREEKKFASVEDLKNQIRQDILEAERVLGGQ